MLALLFPICLTKDSIDSPTIFLFNLRFRNTERACFQLREEAGILFSSGFFFRGIGKRAGIDFGPHIEPNVTVADEMVLSVLGDFLIEKVQNGLLFADVGIIGEVSRKMSHTGPKKEGREGVVFVVGDDLIQISGEHHFGN